MLHTKQINGLILIGISLFLISCRVQKSSSVNEEIKDRKFYKQYSAKLGYKLSGNENRRLVKNVNEWLGTPYKFGGCAKAGTDCSCLMQTFYKEVYFIDIPRSSSEIYAKANKINKQELKEGDLLFYAIGTTTVSHVGLYLGNNKFVHASTTKGVMINDITEAYFVKCFLGAGRFK